MKPRRIDLYPDDWIAGQVELDNEHRGVYAMLIMAIYSHGGPVEFDHLRRLCPGHARTHHRIVQNLIARGKAYVTDDGKLSAKRCETELKNARKRLETFVKNGAKGGRVSGKNNEVAEPGGSLAREGITKTTTLSKKEKGHDDGRLGASRLSERPTSDDLVAVDQIVATVARRSKRVVRDPLAYNAAVESSIWNSWLNALATFVSEDWDTAKCMPKLDAIEMARAAGSRQATSPDIRRLLNDIARQRAVRARNGRGAAAA